jgi:hypothetical protein
MRNGKYILVKAPQDYPGLKYRGRYVYEHHLNWWLSTGELVLPGYVIHHIDENKHNNSIDNLVLLSANEHNKEHAELAKDKHRVSVNCFVCKKERKVKGNAYRNKVKAGQSKFYCSRDCQHKGLKHGSR